VKIGSKYISRNSVLGYHWYRTTCLGRTYFCIDLINGSQLNILTHLGTGEEVSDVSDIIKWIEGR
jgi:hypothetical protein